MVKDAELVEAVGALGGYVTVSGQQDGKVYWPEVAHRLGLKQAKAMELQHRYELLLESVHAEELDDDGDDAHDDGDGDYAAHSDRNAADDEPPKREIRKILEVKVKKGKQKYHVEWADGQSAWVFEGQLRGCEKAVKAFHDEHKRKKRAAEGAGERSAPPAKKQRSARDGGAPDEGGEQQQQAEEQDEEGEDEETVLCARGGRGRPRAPGAPGPSAMGWGGSLTAAPTHPAPRPHPHRCGWLSSDRPSKVLGPVNTQKNWLVRWASGRRSVVTNEQLRMNEAGLLLDWYEDMTVFTDPADAESD